MGLFSDKLDINNLPITSEFLEAEAFAPCQISIDGWKGFQGYSKTIIGDNKRVKIQFIPVQKLLEEMRMLLRPGFNTEKEFLKVFEREAKRLENADWVLHDPKFYMHLGYVEDFFENINTAVITVGDYGHFVKRTLLKFQIYERLCQRNKERMIQKLEKSISYLKDDLEALRFSFDDAKPLLGYGVI